MVGSKTSIRLCTFCWEEDGKIVYGEREMTLTPIGKKVLVCQAHKDRLRVEGKLGEDSAEPRT